MLYDSAIRPAHLASIESFSPLPLPPLLSTFLNHTGTFIEWRRKKAKTAEPALSVQALILKIRTNLTEKIKAQRASF